MLRGRDYIEYIGVAHGTVINRLIAENIRVYSAKSIKNKLILCTNSRERQKIIVLFDGLCYNYKIIKSIGLRAVAVFLRNRFVIPVGLLLAIILVSLIPNFVYKIEITGAEGAYAEVVNVLNDNGVVKGAPVGKVNIVGAMQSINEIEGIAYCDVNVIGSTVKVNVYRELPKVTIIDVTAATSVISAFDAVVTRQLVFSGTAVFNAGDVVRKGEALITGEIAVGDETVETGARGEVYGLVVYKSCVLFNGTLRERVRSGKVFSETILGFLGLEGREKGSPYAMFETQTYYDTYGFLFPMRVKRQTYFEIIDRKIHLSFAEAEETLKEKALSAAFGAIPDNAVVKDKKTTVRQSGEGYIVEAAITVEQRIDHTAT